MNCENSMEFDEYDSHQTTYIFGVYQDHVICSLRFIETKYANMISCGEFNAYLIIKSLCQQGTMLKRADYLLINNEYER